MRFSSAFQPPAMPQPAARSREALQTAEAHAQTPIPVSDQELPEDLDARVRLVGEWQLGEVC